MSLLREIQRSLMDGGGVGIPLIKFRYLSSRLGSAELESWVKHETEGYPDHASVPTFRLVEVLYVGTFTNGVRTIGNIEIPNQTILSISNKKFINYPVRSSIAVIDRIVRRQEEDRGIRITNTADLAPLLHNKVFDGYHCLHLLGKISGVSFSEIQETVRNKMLDMTIEFEKKIPEILEIDVGKPSDNSAEFDKAVTQIFYQNIGGSLINASSIGQGGTITIQADQGDLRAAIKNLQESGVPVGHAEEFMSIVAEDGPESATEPLSKRAQNWLAERAKDIAQGAWGVSLSVATDLLKRAAKSYLGMP